MIQDALLSFSNLNVSISLNFLISLGLAFCGFFFAFSIKQRHIRGKWFTSLRYILTAMSIASLSNVYAIIILGYRIVQPSELILHGSLFILMVWAASYYIVNILGTGTSLTEEKVLKFIETEHLPSAGSASDTQTNQREL